jgi:threonine dehydrogenase-like Zn-dependent dehydrogenase
MNVARLQADGELVAGTAPEPVAGPGQLVIEVAGAGICGSDLHATALGIPAGSVLGHEISGRVAEVGPGGDAFGWTIGDPVCAIPVHTCGVCGPCLHGNPIRCERDGRLVGLGGTDGGFAEHVVVDARQTYGLPADLDPALGSLVEPLAVGLSVASRAAVEPGEATVVLGAGPVGLAIVLWLRALGAGDVVVSEPVAGRRVLAERCGATAVVDPRVEELVPAARAALRARPDVVIEAAGARGTIATAVDLAPYGGRIVVAGQHVAPEELPLPKTFTKVLTISFSSWYRRQHYRHALRLLGQGRIDPSLLVTHTVGLEELPEAFAALRRPNDQGKVLVSPLSPGAVEDHGSAGAGQSQAALGDDAALHLAGPAAERGERRVTERVLQLAARRRVLGAPLEDADRSQGVEQPGGVVVVGLGLEQVGDRTFDARHSPLGHDPCGALVEELAHLDVDRRSRERRSDRRVVERTDTRR